MEPTTNPQTKSSTYSEWVPTSNIALKGETMIRMSGTQRRSFERRWYDNNFFDDGFHFRYISRTTGKIIDLTDRGQVNVPHRAIPKASRQIRGVANLILQPEYRPVVYPQRVSRYAYTDQNQYVMALEKAKREAKRTGHWITYEWDKQELDDKLVHMLLLAAKHGVSYVKIWPDEKDGKINSVIRDAFEIYLVGSLNSIYDSPFMIEATPELITNILANERFDGAQREKLLPDNKYANSEIKQAYMQARFQMGMMQSEQAATILLKEGFVKEYLNDRNYEQIAQIAGPTGAMEGKKNGDMIVRHVFWAGNTWLMDEYVDIPDYPYVDYRFEPGPIYQVPLIERFIPANKTLDIISSRIERFANTMVTGTWLARKGENFEITNIPGGQVLNYTSIPPTQGAVSSVPPFMFQFMQFLEKTIEEQGASTSSLGTLPEGVKSGVAIESVKSTEYANLKTPSMMLKKTVKNIAKKMLEIADEYFIDPQTVYLLEKDMPDYFDVIGGKGAKVRQKLNGQLPPETVVLRADCPVDIEVETGLGFTMEGRKKTMEQITNFIIQLAQQQLLNPQAVKVVVGKFLETYNFGATQDFLDALEDGGQQQQMTEDQITQMKVAVAEVLKDTGFSQQDQENAHIDRTKLAVAQVLKDVGFKSGQQQVEKKEPSKSISFKDLPNDGKSQLAQQAGIQLSPSDFAVHEANQKGMELLSHVIKSSTNKNAADTKQNGSSTA